MSRIALPRTFFNRPAPEVARDLIGARLTRRVDGLRVTGVITETEAYLGETDLACHARAGRTPRTATMYGPPGHAYIYFTYGMHWMLNFVTGPEGEAAAVLIRAIAPIEGQEFIAARRPAVPEARRTDGPAKLCRALDIDGALNGIDLCAPESPIRVESGAPVAAALVRVGPRVGIDRTPEPWLSMPWRFWVEPEVALSTPLQQETTHG